MTSILKVDTIQDQSGNNIINENADTITIGASGDTITIPAGATLSNLGTASGFGLTWQSVKTADFTAVKGEAYPVNTTSAVITVTLPATPSVGDQVQLVDYAGTFDTNPLIINPNGEDIEGGTDNSRLDGEREGVILTYIDSTQGWIATSGINEGTDALEPDTTTVDFLVVAGGGGGARGRTSSRGGGGGGAGGYRTDSSFLISIGTSYTVTVGGGGTGSSTGTNDQTNGSNSVFTTITSAGGGRAGDVGTADPSGFDGGSGGGASAGFSEGLSPGGSGNTPVVSPSQGNNGGSANDSTGGGGGGGSSGAGGNATGASGGTAGAGTSSSITGTGVTRAVGGAGGANTGGASGANASVNTGNGGGGGGGSINTGNNGGNGGSGIVIIKYPDTFTISNPGGGLTSSTSTAGGFSVTSFTAGTGNIQLNY